MSLLSNLIITVKLKNVNNLVVRGNGLLYKIHMQTSIEKRLSKSIKSKIKSSIYEIINFQKRVVSMMPRTKLLKRIQSAVLSFGASIAVAFDPILYRSITIASIAPSNSIAFYCKFIICCL